MPLLVIVKSSWRPQVVATNSSSRRIAGSLRFRRYVGGRDRRAAYFPVGKLYYGAFGSLGAFQLACLYWVPIMLAAAWLIEA